jgi:hypothetical protein
MGVYCENMLGVVFVLTALHEHGKAETSKKCDEGTLISPAMHYVKLQLSPISAVKDNEEFCTCTIH